MRVVVMGVTGSGKSTVGRMLADRVKATFADADDFHSTEAIEKMSRDIPLTDDDRWPWLERIGSWLAEHDDSVVACSALTREYRDVITMHAPETLFIHLYAAQRVLEDRVRRRSKDTGHFAGAGLLDSQYRDLVPLGPDERGASIDISQYTPAGAVLIARTAIDAAF